MEKKLNFYDPYADQEGPALNSYDLEDQALITKIKENKPANTNGTNQTTSSSNKTTSSSSNKTSGGYVKPEWMSDASYAGITAKRDVKSDPDVAAALAGIAELESKIENPTYAETMKSILAEYEGRNPFSYDYATDPMFQNMMAGYKAQGQLAMENAMAEAAGLTGGYASSWSQSAGQQAFDQYLQQGYNNLPQYYQMALDAYNQEGNDILKRFDMYASLDEMERQRLADQLGIKKTELDFYLDNYNNTYKDEKDLATFFAGIEETEYKNEQAALAAEAQQEQDYIDQLAKQIAAAYERGTYDEFIASLPVDVVGSDEFQQALWANGMTKNSTDKVVEPKKTATEELIESRLSSFDDNDDLETYLLNLEKNGIITTEQRKKYYAIYKEP